MEKTCQCDKRAFICRYRKVHYFQWLKFLSHLVTQTVNQRAKKSMHTQVPPIPNTQSFIPLRWNKTITNLVVKTYWEINTSQRENKWFTHLEWIRVWLHWSNRGNRSFTCSVSWYGGKVAIKTRRQSCSSPHKANIAIDNTNALKISVVQYWHVVCFFSFAVS